MNTQEYKEELCALLMDISSLAEDLDLSAFTRRGTIVDATCMDFRDIRKHAEIVRLTSQSLRRNLTLLDDWLQKTEESTDN